MTPIGPRVAIVGLHLEANGFAPVTTRHDFLAECWEEGEAISEQARRVSHLPLELSGFYDRMDATGPWQEVPLIVLAAQPGGPMEQAVFDDFLAIAERRLHATGPVDAVYVCSHGGSLATGDDDNDGTLVVRMRALVGRGVPIVVTHDLHCNVSRRMIDAADALVAYRTNPHVDHRDCGSEAADILRRMTGPEGLRTAKAHVRVPIVPWPATTMLSTDGPYADLLRMARQLSVPPVVNISVTAGFVLSDLPKCGITVNVTTDRDQPLADDLARRIAAAAWSDRDRYFADLISSKQAVAMASEAAAGVRVPLILADVADNPGGGGLGNTTWLLRALHEAGTEGVILGLFCDPALATQAHAAGVGARIEATFAPVESEFTRSFVCPVTVQGLHPGSVVGRRGRDAGREIVLGPTALVALEGSGIQVVVTSLREQPADPMPFEMFGIDIAQARVAVLKSCAHFRAGFDEFFPPDRIFEVDVPGLTSNVLQNFTFCGLQRPIWPIDRDFEWAPPAP
ncbi:MlrC family protein 3 [Frigidibacter albus]|uniref:Microcystinase C n=1 Tax=Frigidibacter albus TaxID=1465486 RepID=A0A6L8VIY5_9RHOB|nr:M81 family metallopeptidase [Frigidibacter albus]MZQ89269.1 MlrC family protein 3 [Frigidibacter albus]NBE31175.1 MlrC family protein 3 [Frigidibacter albus]GGH53299.1 microcystinase C [Frigidibacter albus]